MGDGRAALVIAGKDLRERVRDRSVFIFALLAPLGLAFIFSAVFGGAFGVDLDLDLAVVDEDGGELARAFTGEVLPGLAASGVATITRSDDAAATRDRVSAGELTAAFVIPAGFTDAVRSGEPAHIEVVGNADADIGTQVASAVAAEFAADVSAVQLAVGAALGPGAGPAARAELADRLASRPSPIALGVIDADRRELDAVTYLSAGMAVFFLFFTVQYGVSGLLEERRLGTLPRLRAAPIGYGAIIGGKLLTSFVLGIVAMTVLVVATDLLIGAEWGDPLGVAVLVVAGVAAATAVMSVVAAVARTAEQANVWQSIVGVVLGALGGSFFPVAADGALATVALISPHRWFLRGLAELAGGAGATAALPAALALTVFTLAGFALAGGLIRRGGLT